ncbi:hypothetical protein Tco_0619502 [Tanacetum coccineum]
MDFYLYTNDQISLYRFQAFHYDAIMGQMLYQFQENQRDYFSNDTFRGRSRVSSAVYYEVTPPDILPLRYIFRGVTPRDYHWTVVKNILKYLRNTKDMFIVYGGDLERELKVTGYTDVGSETDKDDRKSQIEAEYIAPSEAAMEAVWFRKFISRLGVIPINKEPMKIYYDNTCAIIIANEPGV